VFNCTQRLLGNNIVHEKKDVGMGLFVQCLYALSLHLVSVVFGTAIPTSLPNTKHVRASIVRAPTLALTCLESRDKMASKYGEVVRCFYFLLIWARCQDFASADHTW